MSLIFQQNDVALSYTLPAGVNQGVVDWMVSTGIDRQEDRFGNALTYTWQTDASGGFDMYITEIANNRTPVKLILENNFKPFGIYGPALYSKLKFVDEQSNAHGVMEFGGGIETYTYCTLNLSKKYSFVNNQAQMHYDVNYDTFDFTLDEQYPPPYMNFTDHHVFIEIDHYSDGTVKAVSNLSFRDTNYASEMPYRVNEHEYSYSYDSDGNLITVTDTMGHVAKEYYDPGTLIKREIVTTSNIGAPVSTTVETFQYENPTTQDGFDPYDYCDPYYTGGGSFHPKNLWNLAFKYSFNAGAGGQTRTEYSCKDIRFPTKPTEVIEYFYDSEDDDAYDRYRKTTYQYDNFGDVIEQRVYVDSNNYVLTTYEYHDVYRFQTKQTTWQDYCQDDINGNPVTTGLKKSEQQWIYGLADGTIDNNDPNNNIFLIKQKQLLDEDASQDWQYAETFYVYYPLEDDAGTTGQLECGQLKYKQVMQDSTNSSISYYEYDTNGFVSREWNGAQISNGQPVGDPQKRYYYNSSGHKELEANYLGQVTMYVVEPAEGCVLQERIYKDLTAMSLGTFDPSVYDNNIDEDDQYDTWESRTIYDHYDPYGHWSEKRLPTGGRISRMAYYDGKTEALRYYDDDGYGSDLGAMYTGIDTDGKVLFVDKYDANSNSLMEYHIYDSMNRLVHRYFYEYGMAGSTSSVDPEDFPNPYLTHTEFGYLASGEKTYEKVWKIKRAGYNSSDGFRDPVLEKCVGYDYDILGRMTAQATWIDPNEVDPNNLVPEASDPNCMVVKYGYNATGNKIYTIDPAGNYIFTDYDNANRKVREYFAEPNDTNVSTTYANAQVKTEVEYYLDGKVKSKTSYDYNGTVLAVSEFYYDSRGRAQEVKQLIKDNDTNGQISAGDDVAETTYTYSDEGTADGPLPTGGTSGTDDQYHIVITDAESKETGILLTYHGKPNIVTYPSGDYEEYLYYNYAEDGLDPWNGLLKEKSVWVGNVKQNTGIQYEYDEFAKTSRITYPDGYLEYVYTDRVFGKYGLTESIADYRNSEDRPGDLGSTYVFDYNLWSETLRSYTDANDFVFNYDYNTAYNSKTSINVTSPSDELIYSATYDYDLAGRMIDVNDMHTAELAHFDYDANGNRSKLTYYLEGVSTGDSYGLGYTYNIDNLLTGITSFDTAPEDPYDDAVYAFNASGPTDIDGLGRLKLAAETVTDSTQTSKSLLFDHGYDMMSQLTDWDVYDWNAGANPPDWYATPTQTRDFDYNEDGNVDSTTIDSGTPTGYGYDGDLMDAIGGTSLDWDDNGQLTTSPAAWSFDWNWDGKLRSGSKYIDAERTDTVAIKYDPMGNRVYKSSTVDNVTTRRKYIVDISGKLPTILCEIDTSDGSLKKSYFYADAQILAQREHTVATDPNFYDQSFYVYDRLGSVRMVVAYDGTNDVVETVNSYTYTPFGQDYGTPDETVDNPFQFTGQWHDSEIDQYYLRARQYDPTMMRFTSRDPVRGKYEEPLTLHEYLYCLNDPIDRTDINGKLSIQVANGLRAATMVYAAGVGIAAYGADNGNFDMIMLGAAIAEASPLAFAIGYSTTPEITQVTRWGGGFQPGSYGIQGGGGFFNYLKTMKWTHYFLPGKTGAAPWDSTTAYYLTDSLYMPTGALSYIDLIFGFVKVPF